MSHGRFCTFIHSEFRVITSILFVSRGEISVLSSQNRKNRNNDVLVMTVERAHMADMVGIYENYEIVTMLVCGGPRYVDVTKDASDQFHLFRMLKDQLDNLLMKVQTNDLYVLGLYVR